jgi:hypothetical protein
MTELQINKGTIALFKKAEEQQKRDPATWVDRGLLGGIGYGAKNITEGHALKGIGQILGSPIGAIKGGMNAAATAGEDYSRAISQLSNGHVLNALTNGVKGVYNTSIGPIQAALFGRGLMSPRQMERHKNPELEQL